LLCDVKVGFRLVEVSLAYTETGGKADDREEKYTEDDEKPADEIPFDADERVIFNVPGGKLWRRMCWEVLWLPLLALVIKLRRLFRRAVTNLVVSPRRLHRLL
jgi:hypothetical protein